MKKFLKRFPLTSYSIFVVLMAFVINWLLGDMPRDEILPIDPLFWLIILSIPLIGIGQIYNFLNIEASLPWVIPICFLLDLFLLYIRKYLINRFKR